MADVYATITAADPATLERLAHVIELRAADPRQAAIREEFLATAPFPENAKVLEIGCGTGAICRAIAARPAVAEVIGVDPSPAFLQHARQLASGNSRISFVEADGRAIPLGDCSFDVVVFTPRCATCLGPSEPWRKR